MIDLISVYVGITGLYIAGFGLGGAVGCYLWSAPNTNLYEWLGHWSIVIGSLMYMCGFAMITPEFFRMVGDSAEWTAVAFFIGVLAVWGATVLDI